MSREKCEKENIEINTKKTRELCKSIRKGVTKPTIITKRRNYLTLNIKGSKYTLPISWYKSWWYMCYCYLVVVSSIPGSGNETLAEQERAITHLTRIKSHNKQKIHINTLPPPDDNQRVGGWNVSFIITTSIINKITTIAYWKILHLRKKKKIVTNITNS